MEKSISNYEAALGEKAKQEILPETIQEMKDALTIEELHHEKTLHYQAANHFQDYVEQKTRYTENQEILSERNSYSKSIMMSLSYERKPIIFGEMLLFQFVIVIDNVKRCSMWGSNRDVNNDKENLSSIWISAFIYMILCEIVIGLISSDANTEIGIGLFRSGKTPQRSSSNSPMN